MTDTLVPQLSNILFDVNLILENDLFDISDYFSAIGDLFVDVLGDVNYKYSNPPGCGQSFTVLYLTTLGNGKFPVGTISAVGPDVSQRQFSMQPLFDYYTAYNTLTITGANQPGFLRAVNEFIRAYKGLQRYFGAFIDPQNITPEDLYNIYLYGGLDRFDRGNLTNYELLSGYLNNISLIIALNQYEMAYLLISDYNDLENESQDNGLLALSRGLTYTINKRSRVWNNKFRYYNNCINDTFCTPVEL